jgi:competence factor
MKKLMSKKKGFTLVELLVVVAIIAILMLIALPKFMDATGGAKVRVFEANARTLISEANTALASAAGDSSKVKVTDLASFKADKSSKFNGKPAGSTYTFTEATTGTTATPAKLTCTLSAGSGAKKDGVDTEYKIEYNLSNGEITQTADITGAADFKTN